MTNKEAIELIQGIEEDGRNVTSEHIEALDLAIKALEEYPTDKEIQDDMRRTYLGGMTTIDNAPTVCGNNPKWCESCVSNGKCASTRPRGEITNEDIQNAIKQGYNDGYEMANAKYERPQGEWQITKAGYAKCHICKCEREVPENYCGYCGADMRGEKK